MSEQSFLIPRAWNVAPLSDAQVQTVQDSVVSITLAGYWPEDLKERVLDAMRWAATRAALWSRYGDTHYAEHWERKNPPPVGLRSAAKRDDGARG